MFILNKCRCCANKIEGRKFSIFNSKSRKIQLSEMIKICTGIKVLETDTELPQVMCEQCIRMMVSAFDFMELSLRSKKRLIEWRRKNRQLKGIPKDTEEIFEEIWVDEEMELQVNTTTKEINENDEIEDNENIIGIKEEKVDSDEEIVVYKYVVEADEEEEPEDEECTENLDMDDNDDYVKSEEDDVPKASSSSNVLKQSKKSLLSKNRLLKKKVNSRYITRNEISKSDRTLRKSFKTENLKPTEDCCCCASKFEKYEELITHSKEKHLSEREFSATEFGIECQICFKIFPDFNSLDEEHKKHENFKRMHIINYNFYRCCEPECDKFAFCTYSDMIEHRNDFHEPVPEEDPENEYSCLFCSRVFQSNQEVHQHMVKVQFSRDDCQEKVADILEHTLIGKRCCKKICYCVFNTNEELLMHGKIHHKAFKMVFEETKPFECEICYNHYRTNKMLLVHRKYVDQLANKKFKEFGLKMGNEKPKIKCSLCPASVTDMEAHLRKHTQIVYNLTCEICGKLFAQKGNYESHMLIHTEEKKFTCSLCPKKFRTKFLLKLHVMNHLGQKPHKCGYCEKTFTYRSDKVRHEISVHTKDYPLACSNCSKKFIRKSHLRTHEGNCVIEQLSE